MDVLLSDDTSDSDPCSKNEKVFEIDVPRGFNINDIPYKEEINSVQDYAKMIYNFYIKFGAEWGINISGDVRTELTENMNDDNFDWSRQCALHLFDTAGHQITGLLQESWKKLSDCPHIKIHDQQTSGYTLEYSPERIKDSQFNKTVTFQRLKQMVI